MKNTIAERIKSAYAQRAALKRSTLPLDATGMTDQEVEAEMAAMSEADRQFWSDALKGIARDTFGNEPRDRRRLEELADEILSGSKVAA